MATPLTPAGAAAAPPLSALTLGLKMDEGALAAVASLKSACPSCGKKKPLYCPDCLVPTSAALPTVRLPLKLDILRGTDEKASKSTAGQAVVLAPSDARIFYLPAMPHYEDPTRVLLLYPSHTALPARRLPDLSAFDTVLVVDTTWQKSSGVMGRLAAQPFTHVLIEEYETLFWRYQSVGPACLATLEAIYFFMREFEVERLRRGAGATGPAAAAAAVAAPSSGLLADEGAAGSTEAAAAAAASASSAVACAAAADSAPAPAAASQQLLPAVHPSDPGNTLYKGDFDNLLLLYMRQYRAIQENYTTGAAAAAGKAFTTKQRAGYIKGPQQQPLVGGDGAAAGAGSASSSGVGGNGGEEDEEITDGGGAASSASATAAVIDHRIDGKTALGGGSGESVSGSSSAGAGTGGSGFPPAAAAAAAMDPAAASAAVAPADTAASATADVDGGGGDDGADEGAAPLGKRQKRARGTWAIKTGFGGLNGQQ